MLGFEPTMTTAEAFADFGASLTPTGGAATRVIDGVARVDRRRAAAPRPAAS